MSRTTGALTAAMAGTLLAVAAGAFAAPETLARAYGVPVSDAAARGYVRAVGVRDATLGAVVAALAFSHEKRALAMVLALTSLVGAGDFAIARAHGARWPLALHGGGVAALVLAATLTALES